MKEYKCNYFQIDWYDEIGDFRQERYEQNIKVRVKDNDNRFSNFSNYDNNNWEDMGIAVGLTVDKDFFKTYQENDWFIIDFT